MYFFLSFFFFFDLIFVDFDFSQKRLGLGAFYGSTPIPRGILLYDENDFNEMKEV
jgi:hypothetical protein